MRKYPYLPWILLLAGTIGTVILAQRIEVKPGKTSVEKYEEKYGSIK